MMEALMNALPLMVVALLTAQTLMMAFGLAQIARISGELGHLSQRQTFLESLVKPATVRERSLGDGRLSGSPQPLA
jgi:hypothetical protein